MGASTGLIRHRIGTNLRDFFENGTFTSVFIKRAEFLDYLRICWPLKRTALCEVSCGLLAGFVTLVGGICLNSHCSVIIR